MAAADLALVEPSFAASAVAVHDWEDTLAVAVHYWEDTPAAAVHDWEDTLAVAVPSTVAGRTDFQCYSGCPFASALPAPLLHHPHHPHSPLLHPLHRFRCTAAVEAAGCSC